MGSNRNGMRQSILYIDIYCYILGAQEFTHQWHKPCTCEWWVKIRVCW